MTPEFMVLADGINITPQIADRLIGLTVIDEAGVKADAVEITLDDRDGLIELPAPGAVLRVMLGYKETGLVPMGEYTADEVTVSSPPATMVIRATSAALGGSVKGQKTRSWDKVTIGQIVSTIAGEHGLIGKTAAKYANVRIDHIDQTDESDLNLLDRIGRDRDALVSVKGGTLLFMGRGEGQTVGGVPIPPRPLLEGDTTSWSLTLTTRENYRSVIAVWQDRSAAKKIEVKAGDGDPQLKLRHIHASEAEAQDAARAKLDEIMRGNDSFEATLIGDPLIAAEGRVVAAGFRAGVNGIWSITSATHELGSGGYSTTIRAERPAPD